MAKIGRNEPCPCNSGKKYKHCHGAAHPAPARPAEAAKPAMPLSQEARLKPMGMPGVTQHLIGAFRFRDPADPRNLSGPAGLVGGELDGGAAVEGHDDGVLDEAAGGLAVEVDEFELVAMQVHGVP